MGNGNGNRNGKTENGEFLSHPSFADEIALFSQSIQDLQCMLCQLCLASMIAGLKIKAKKSKVIWNQHTKIHPFRAGNKALETVTEYVYLEQVRAIDPKHEREITRRISAGCTKGAPSKRSGCQSTANAIGAGRELNGEMSSENLGEKLGLS